MPSSATVAASSEEPKLVSRRLPREILMWLSSLDLSLPIRTPRRSLSNGMLFGEILAVFYPHDVPLHGLDKGSGRRARRANWHALKKVIAKRSINISDDIINETINEVSGAAETVLCIIYSHLTKKPLDLLLDTNSEHERESADRQNSAGIVAVANVKATSAAKVLLSLNPLQARQTTIAEILTRETGLNDWTQVMSRQARRSPSTQSATTTLMRRLYVIKDEFEAAAATDTKASVLRFLSYCWMSIRETSSSPQFKLGLSLLVYFVPLYIGCSALASQHLLESIDSNLLPFGEIPEIEKKLGYLAEIFALLAAQSEREVLAFLRARMSIELYAHVLAGLGAYHDSAFWVNETQNLVLAASLDASLHPALLCLLASLSDASDATKTGLFALFGEKKNTHMHAYLGRLAGDATLSPAAVYGLVSCTLRLPLMSGLSKEVRLALLNRTQEIKDPVIAMALLTPAAASVGNLALIHKESTRGLDGVMETVEVPTSSLPASHSIAEGKYFAGVFARLLTVAGSDAKTCVLRRGATVIPIAYSRAITVVPLSAMLSTAAAKEFVANGIAAACLSSSDIAEAMAKHVLPYAAPLLAAKTRSLCIKPEILLTIVLSCWKHGIGNALRDSLSSTAQQKASGADDQATESGPSYIGRQARSEPANLVDSCAALRILCRAIPLKNFSQSQNLAPQILRQAACLVCFLAWHSRKRIFVLEQKKLSISTSVKDPQRKTDASIGCNARQRDIAPDAQQWFSQVYGEVTRAVTGSKAPLVPDNEFQGSSLWDEICVSANTLWNNAVPGMKLPIAAAAYSLSNLSSNQAAAEI